MTKDLPPTVARLARSNPVAPDDTRGRTPKAQAQLVAILASENEVLGLFQRVRRRRIAPLALAVALLIGASALAATNPLGFWEGKSPATATFVIDRGRHVSTPLAQTIACPTISAAGFRCMATRVGRRYRLLYRRIATIHAAGRFDRASVLHGLTDAVATKRISPRLARRIRADLATVPHDFFAHFNALLRFRSFTLAYSTPFSRRFGSGHPAVTKPEAQVRGSSLPLLLVCERGRALAVLCQSLDGDHKAPIGSGIYGLLVAPGWTPVPAAGLGPRAMPWRLLARAVFGHDLTPGTWRLVSSLLMVTRPFN